MKPSKTNQTRWGWHHNTVLPVWYFSDAFQQS